MELFECILIRWARPDSTLREWEGEPAVRLNSTPTLTETVTEGAPRPRIRGGGHTKCGGGIGEQNWDD